ncbi:hypothetical protein J0H58_36545, partial [bacterium]|nr:hypothetical protein [bacterium]
MQVNPTTAAAAPAAASGPVPLRILAGQLTAVPVGQLIQATVTQTSPKGATLAVNGQPVTVAPSPQLTPGTSVVVRLPAAAAPVLELVGTVPTPTPPSPGAALPPPAGRAAPAAPAPAAPATAAPVRVLAGNLSAVPAGQLIRATVTQSGPQGATLAVNGQRVTVAPSPQLSPGAAVVVRLPSAAAPVLELVGPTPTTTAAPAPTAAPPSPIALVDVRAAAPDGRFHVTIDGQPATVTSEQPLVPGGRYALRVEAAPAGLVLRPLAESPAAPETA